MKKIEIKVKKLNPDAKLPTQAHDTDVGWDLYAMDCGDMYCNDTGEVMYIQYDTGIAIEPPDGYHIEIYPRSSVTNKCLMLKNSVGIIDPSYRNSIKVRFHSTNGASERNHYKTDDKIAQMIVRLTIPASLLVVDELSNTERGLGGFGSSDKTKQILDTSVANFKNGKVSPPITFKF